MLSSIIVGAGKIGAFFDSPESKHVLTHAHAYHNDPRYKIEAFIDSSNDRSIEACSIWGGVPFSDFQEYIKDNKPDVVSLCTPVQYRLPIIKLLDSDSFLFLEKPLAEDIDSLEVIYKTLKKKNINTCVNYTRRFTKEIKLLKNEIDKDRWGKLLRGNIFYTKGFKNNGTHLVHLINYLFGLPLEFSILGEVEDYSSDDLTLETRFVLEEGGVINMCPLSEKLYSNIEITLFFEKGRIHLKQFGELISRSEIRKDPLFPGYSDIDENPQYESTGLMDSFKESLNMIYNFKKSNTEIESDLDEAYLTEKFVHTVYLNRTIKNKVFSYEEK